MSPVKPVCKSLFPLSLVTLLGISATALAAPIPANLQTLYDSLKAPGSQCKHVLQTGFYSEEGGPKTFSYCGDHIDPSSGGIIYISGPSGQLANMDIDCDGAQDAPANDHRCGSSSDTQSITAFADTIASYSIPNLKDVNAYKTPYVVFGNSDDSHKSGSSYTTFSPQQYGIEPLSLMAVVCNNQVIYGIWGDENGSDGPPMVGEASIGLASACFGDGAVNGNKGHDANDVLYVAFTGKGAVPGAKGADWGAGSVEEFQASVRELGERLVAGIK